MSFQTRTTGFLLTEHPQAGGAVLPRPERFITTTVAGLSIDTSHIVAVRREHGADGNDRSQAIGRRGDAVARVVLRPGSGRIIVNGRDVAQYFVRSSLLAIVQAPLRLVGHEDRYDVACTVRGGGLAIQAAAVKLGIAHALVRHDPTVRSVIERAGLLSRERRLVERRKLGRAKAGIRLRA